MKITLSFFFISLCSLATAQTNNTTNKNDFFGYINGIRLDSIHAHYAVVYSRDEITKKQDENGSNSPYLNPMQLCFSFQVADRKQDEFIRDIKGNTISFSRNVAAILNFLYYNGRELVKVLDNSPSNTQSEHFLVRKKDIHPAAVLE